MIKTISKSALPVIFSGFLSVYALSAPAKDPFKEYERCLEIAESVYKSCLEANTERLYRCLNDYCTNATYVELCNDACFEEKENNDVTCKDNYDIAKIECEDVFKQK